MEQHHTPDPTEKIEIKSTERNFNNKPDFSKNERLVLYFGAILLFSCIYILYLIHYENLLEYVIAGSASMAFAMLSRFLLGKISGEIQIGKLKISKMQQGFAIFILSFFGFFLLIPGKSKADSLDNIKQTKQDTSNLVRLIKPDEKNWDVDYNTFCWFNALYVKASKDYFPTHYKNIKEKGTTYQLLLFAPNNEKQPSQVFKNRFEKMRLFIMNMRKLAIKDGIESQFADHLEIKVVKDNNLPTYSFFYGYEERKEPYTIIYLDKVFSDDNDTPIQMLKTTSGDAGDKFHKTFYEYWSIGQELDYFLLVDEKIKFNDWNEYSIFLKLKK